MLTLLTQIKRPCASQSRVSGADLRQQAREATHMSRRVRESGVGLWGRASLPTLPRAQVGARVASVTKRARLRALLRMSPNKSALALFARPNQGERWSPRRVWQALRLSA